jgi:hypothetical protein
MILRPDGSDWREVTDEAPRGDAETMGARAGQSLKAMTPPGFLPTEPARS